jgi:hypothetical protein
MELAKSPNTKIVITDGKGMPLMMDANVNGSPSGTNTMLRCGN